MKIWKKITKRTWCQGAEARTKDGLSVRVGDPKAIRFCAVGLLRRHIAPNKYCEMRNRLLDIIGQNDLTSWNDTPARTAQEVRDAFRRANI